MLSIRSTTGGHDFYPYGAIKQYYHCDIAIAEMLDDIILAENAKHPLWHSQEPLKKWYRREKR